MTRTAESAMTRSLRGWMGAGLFAALVACGGGQSTGPSEGPEPERPSEVEAGSATASETTSGPVAVVERVDPLVEAAQLYASAGSGSRPYGRIESLIREAIDEDPANADAWFNLGVIQMEQGDEQAAISSWEQAGEVDSTYARGLANIGYVQLQRGQTDAAVATFERCLERRETEPGCNINLSLLYRTGEVGVSGDVDTAAIEKLRLALGGDGRNAEAYANIARIYHEQGRLELARLVCENAMILGIDEAVLHNRLGLIALDQEDVITAYAEFRRAVAADADYLDAWLNIGAMALSFRDYEASLEAFDVVLAARPDDHEVRLSYGAALRGLDQYEAAEAEYRQVLEASPGNLGALYNMAVLYQEAYGDYAEACRNYGSYLSQPGATSSERYADVERRMESLYNLAVDLVDFGQMDPAVLEACTR